jgi:DNA polymerase III subunit delta'
LTLWDDFLGHEQVRERFRRTIAQRRLGGSYLLVGPPGVGKRTFAIKLAQALLCTELAEVEFDACGHCPGCQQVQALSHPDLIMVGCPEDKSSLPVDLLIGPPQNRLREGFCYDISLKPFWGDRKVGIIDDADTLAQEGANSLLKTLEEPPPGVVLLLIATSLQKQLPTIRSRCQIVQFNPLTTPQVAQILTQQQLVEDSDLIESLAELSEGSLQRAVEMADPELLGHRGKFLEFLAQRDWDAQPLAKATSSFVDAAGKEAPPRRLRLRQLIAVATTFYREQLRLLHGLDSLADQAVVQAARKAIQCPESQIGSVTDCIERCLEAEQQVLANANLATLIEGWLDDLSCLLFQKSPQSARTRREA